MLPFYPFIYKQKKEEEFQQIPLYIEEYNPPPEKKKDEDTESEETVIVIDLW